MFREYGGIPRQAKLLIYLSFIPNMVIGFIYSDLSYFLPKIQGIAPTLTGWVIGTMGLTLVAESIPLGIVADRYGRRNMLLVGNVCASLSLIGFALTSNFALLILVAVVEGTGEASFAVSVSALIADHAGDQKRTLAFSLLSFLGWIASGIGGFVIATVASLQSLGVSAGEAHVILYIAMGLISLAVTPFLLLVKEGTSFNRLKGILPRKSGRIIRQYLVYSMLIAVGAGLFVPSMGYWFSAAYGVSDVISVPVLGVTSLITAFVVFMSPRLAKRFGLVRATVMTEASSTVFMVLIPSSPTFGVAASIYVVRVLLMNLSNPLTQSLIMGLVSPDERGMASGITAALWRLPNSLSTTAGLALFAAGYLALPFYIATVLYVVGIAIFWFVFKDARLPEEAQGLPQAPTQSSSLKGPEVER
ncbi:MAG: MFS transporter [Nitrososphaerota archaeon]|nr:MFS transporter [Nitrososphaerota archaeon]MDG7024807.1 MFS transporter [Nitrososphaerota archaeon]